ncbi:hypothetical protein LINPERPRIM_LOCUS29514 [Linum perenne]
MDHLKMVNEASQMDSQKTTRPILGAGLRHPHYYSIADPTTLGICFVLSCMNKICVFCSITRFDARWRSTMLKRLVECWHLCFIWQYNLSWLN